MLDTLVRLEPDILGVAVHIWNSTESLSLARSYRLALPSSRIIVGGPEVSFDAQKVLELFPEVDGVIQGEGELPFAAAVKRLIVSGLADPLAGIPSLVTRSSGDADDKPLALAQVPSLDELPSPYSRGYEGLNDKIAYYETSRGCPYACGYCLSSVSSGVRYLNLDRVRRELDEMIAAGLMRIKFVDRTFNCNRQHSRAIWSHLIEKDWGNPPYPTTFHFEIGADLLQSEDLDLLAKAPKGLFHFEVGVQSTTPHVLEAVSRTVDNRQLSSNVKRLIQDDKIDIDLDLIAGLPGETRNSFAKSVDDVLHLQPTGIHLGFLKLLKGSRLRDEAEDLGLVYNPEPPYAIIRTDRLTPRDMADFHDWEQLLDMFYNSHQFTTSFRYATEYANGAHHLLETLVSKLPQPLAPNIPHSLRRQVFIECAVTLGCSENTLLDLLDFDQLVLNVPAANRLDQVPRGLLEDVVEMSHTLRQKALTHRELSKRLAIRDFKFDVLSYAENPYLCMEDIVNNVRQTLAFIYPEKSIGTTAVEILRVSQAQS